MRRILFVLAALVVALPALAVGKVTVDPNTPGAAVQEDQNSKTDTRLARKVTLSGARKPVRVILDEMTGSTGVVFKAGYNSGDWQVRDRKMNIFAKDVPLASLMNSIAHVMKFKWNRQGEAGKWSYRLYMDRKTLLDAEAQRARAEEKAAAELTRRRANALARYGETASLSDAEMAKLRADNPLLYIIAQAGLGDSVAAFFREVPVAAEAIASGQRLDFIGEDLSPSAWASLLRAGRAELSLENRFNGHGNARTIPDNLDPVRVSISINKHMSRERGNPEGAFLLGDLTFDYESGSVEAPIIDPESAAAMLIGKMAIQSEDENRPTDDVFKEQMAEFAGAVTKDVKAALGGEPVNNHPDDPALDAKVTLKSPWTALQDVEQDLAVESKFSVVSDSFGGFTATGQLPTPLVRAKEAKIKDVLDNIGDAYIYNWDKRGTVIELRDRNWFRKRAAQVPDAWLEKWRSELIKTSRLDIDSLAQMAQLTQDQMNANITFDETLRECSSVVQLNRELLRMWATLSSDQRAAMFTQSGLDIALLSPDQWTQTRALLSANWDAGVLDSGQPIAVVCRRVAIEKAYIYSFSLLVGGESATTIGEIKTPYYTPPPPAKDSKPVKPADGSKPSDTARPSDPYGDAQPAK